MKKVNILYFTGFLSLVLFCYSSAEDNSYSDKKIKFSGYGYYMFGQLISGIKGDNWEWATTTLNHLWSNTCLQHLNINSDVTEWFEVGLGFELSVYGAQLNTGGSLNKAMFFREYKVNLTSVEGTLHWDFQNPIISSLKVESGLIPFTINPQVKTLGNYLFRSSIHPPTVQNKMDYPWADLLGGIAGVGLFDNKVTFEAIIASEFIYVPWFDFTPAFGLNFKPNGIIDIGGAIAFSHAIPVHSWSLPDTVSYKEWQGTKLDFRAIFDPKPLFGGMGFLKKDQLKIYAELAFLGLEDKLEVDTNNLYTLRFNDPDTTALKDLVFPKNSILHRMPFMIGINLPTWKILDLLSLELEWFHSPYANNWFGLFPKAEAVAPTSLKEWDNYINKDNFKWVINLRKSLGNFEIRSLIGNDHSVYKLINPGAGNFEQTMKRPKDWHWFVELRYNL